MLHYITLITLTEKKIFLYLYLVILLNKHLIKPWG